jgi:hypothetical protein
MADVQIDSSVPDGLNLVSASGGGSVDPDTGLVAWALTGGLDVGSSTTVSITATISQLAAETTRYAPWPEMHSTTKMLTVRPHPS